MYNPEARFQPAPPWLLSWSGLGVLLAATLVSAALSATQVTLLAGSLLALGLGARLWARWSLSGLAYQRRLLPRRVFCDETIVLETSLSNRKLLPLPWVEVWERLPLALDAGDHLEGSSSHPDQAWLCQGTSLWPFQRARWQHRLTCRRRGVYRLAAAWARAGDPFGLCEREGPLRGRLEVVVYPRVVPLRRLALPLRQPLAEAVSRRSLLHDPARPAGAREYQPGDPPRLIHWPASAHLGSLQVRLLEPTTTLQVYLLLSTRSFDLAWQLYRASLFELAVSALASIALYLHRRGCPVGLMTDADPPVILPPGTSPAHLESIMEALARVEPGGPSGTSIWPAQAWRPGATAILAASDRGDVLAADLARLHHAGQRPLLLLAGHAPPPPGLPADQVIRLQPGADLAAVLEGWA